MPSDIGLQIQTQYQPGGMDEATKGVKKFGDTVEDAGNRSSKSMEGLFKRLERPIGMIAFSGLADQLTQMGTKGESTGMMVERGLHAAGIALLYFNPLVGMAVIAGTALSEVFNKVEGAATAEGDAIAKAADEASKAADQSDKYTQALLKQGKLTQEQANTLAMIHHESMDATKDAKENTEAELKRSQAILQGIPYLKQYGDYLKFLFDSYGSGETKLRNYTDALQKFNNANGPDAEAKKPKKSPKEDDAWMTEKRVAQEKLKASTMSLMQLETRESALRADLLKQDQAMASASGKAQVDEIQNRINADQRLLSADTTVSDKMKENARKQTEEYVKLGDSVKTMTESTTQSLIEGGKAGKDAAAKMAGDIIKITAQAMTTKLLIQATADLAAPWTFAIGVAEMAAVGAINGIAGGLAGAISGGGGGSAPSQSASTGQNNVTTPQAGQGQNQQGMNLQINVQGGVIDDTFAQNLLKRLNDQVQQNGASYAMPQVNYA